jgi:hypothetical protein
MITLILFWWFIISVWAGYLITAHISRTVYSTGSTSWLQHFCFLPSEHGHLWRRATSLRFFFLFCFVCFFPNLRFNRKRLKSANSCNDELAVCWCYVWHIERIPLPIKPRNYKLDQGSHSEPAHLINLILTWNWTWTYP